MSDVIARLHALADSLPEGGSAVVPKATLMEWAAVTEGREESSDYGIAALAERFQRSPSTIRGWLQAGVLCGYRLRGREWRVPPASIAAFEESERNGGQPIRRSSQGSADLGAWRSEGAT